jgi:hypothetical protein
MNPASVRAIAADPNWMPWSLDRPFASVELVRLSDTARRELPFLDSRYIDEAVERISLSLAELAAASAALPDARCHFVFHTGLCCSTLLARALDVAGRTTSLKEPNVLGYISEAAARADDVRTVLPTILRLLARPAAPGETVIVKAGNTSNPLIESILETRPRSKALLLSRPLPDFLVSIAGKGAGGRAWVRSTAGFLHRFPAMTGELGPVDLDKLDEFELAACLWLLQHAQFARLRRTLPEDRVAVLDSETLLADPAGCLGAVAEFFDLGFDGGTISAQVNGPAFARHSKRPAEEFDVRAQSKVQAIARAAHGSRIESAVSWAEAIAADAGISVRLE